MDMTDNWLDQNSGGSGNPGVYFGAVGDKVVGRIAGLPKKVDTEFGERLVVELVATDASTAGKGKRGGDGRIVDGDEVTLWLKPGAMAAAVRDAVRAADSPGLSDGGTLAVQFSATKDTGKPEPVKLYVAQYHAPVAAVAVGESLI
jgi:hypothetical protein